MDLPPSAPLLSGNIQTRSDHNSVDDTDEDVVTRATISEIFSSEFYTRERWVDELFEGLFKIRNRGTTIQAEIYFGMIHFVSCLFCLAVIPQQMSQAGYVKKQVFVTTAICSGVGSLICGLFANLPFVIAPPTAVAIFLAVYLQNYEGEIDSLPNVGSSAVMFSGVLLMCLGFRPLGNLVARLIPASIQAGTAVGIGLLTALAGAIEIDLVQSGKFNILLQMGGITMKVVIAFAGIILICVATHYHLKGAFCLAIILCSVSWGVYSGDWPNAVVEIPTLHTYQFKSTKDSHVPLLVVDLLFLYILYLNGLISSLSMIAKLNRADGATPRGRWIFILSGIMTVASGYFIGAPILISPESAAAIKDGAKTGLSTFVCGGLFILSVFFSPLFDAIPTPGTSPVLLMIGVLLFQNTVRIEWTNMPLATPAFVVLFFIPFTYSVIQGVLLGYVVFILVGLFTGSLFENIVIFLHIYLPTELAERILPEDPRDARQPTAKSILSYNFHDFGDLERPHSPTGGVTNLSDGSVANAKLSSSQGAQSLHGSSNSGLGRVEFVDKLVDMHIDRSRSVDFSLKHVTDSFGARTTSTSQGGRRRAQTLSTSTRQHSVPLDHSMVFIDDNLYERPEDSRSEEVENRSNHSDGSRRSRNSASGSHNLGSSPNLVPSLNGSNKT